MYELDWMSPASHTIQRPESNAAGVVMPPVQVDEASFHEQWSLFDLLDDFGSGVNSSSSSSAQHTNGNKPTNETGQHEMGFNSPNSGNMGMAPPDTSHQQQSTAGLSMMVGETPSTTTEDMSFESAYPNEEMLHKQWPVSTSSTSSVERSTLLTLGNAGTFGVNNAPSPKFQEGSSLGFGSRNVGDPNGPTHEATNSTAHPHMGHTQSAWQVPQGVMDPNGATHAHIGRPQQTQQVPQNDMWYQQQQQYKHVNVVKEEKPTDLLSFSGGSHVNEQQTLKRKSRSLTETSGADEEGLLELIANGGSGSSVTEGGGNSRDRRQMNARLSRLKRKQELVELRKRIKGLEEEQKMFASKVADLEEEARILQHSDEQDLKTENELLRQEIHEHRGFVKRLQQLMNKTRTSALELEQHSEKTERLQLRRRCVECAENSLSQCLGLLKMSTHASRMNNGSVGHNPGGRGGASASADAQPWQTALLKGNEDFVFMYELLPRGSTLKTALRMNSRIELNFAKSVQELSRIIRTMHHDTKYRQVLEKHNVLALDNIFTDPEYEGGYVTEKGALRARYVKEMLAGKSVSNVHVTMAKAVDIAVSSLNPDENDRTKLAACVVHCQSDASHIFSSLETPSSDNQATSQTTDLARTNQNKTRLLPTGQKFRIGASIIAPGEVEDWSTLTLVRSEQMFDMLKEGFAVGEDGVVQGVFASRLVDVVVRLQGMIEEDKARPSFGV